jgi:hypothetical protein
MQVSTYTHAHTHAHTHARALMPRSYLHRATTRNAIHSVHGNLRTWQHRPLLGYQLAGKATLLRRDCINFAPSKTINTLTRPFGHRNIHYVHNGFPNFLLNLSSCIVKDFPYKHETTAITETAQQPHTCSSMIPLLARNEPVGKEKWISYLVLKTSTNVTRELAPRMGCDTSTDLKTNGLDAKWNTSVRNPWVLNRLKCDLNWSRWVQGCYYYYYEPYERVNTSTRQN